MRSALALGLAALIAIPALAGVSRVRHRDVLVETPTPAVAVDNCTTCAPVDRPAIIRDKYEMVTTTKKIMVPETTYKTETRTRDKTIMVPQVIQEEYTVQVPVTVNVEKEIQCTECVKTGEEVIETNSLIPVPEPPELPCIIRRLLERRRSVEKTTVKHVERGPRALLYRLRSVDGYVAP